MMHHIPNMDSVKVNAIIVLTAANKQRAALGIEREFPQVHGTSGFDRQSAMECEIQQDWAQQHSTQNPVKYKRKIKRGKGLGKEIMMITSLETFEHTAMCTYIQKYPIGHDPETARLTTQTYEVRAKGTGLGKIILP